MKSIPRSIAGFSLLEVLVALSIMALSLGVLYHAAAGGVRNAAHLERHAHALVIAEGLLSRMQTVPTAGVSTSGQTPDGFRWSLLSVPLPRSGAQTDSVKPWPFHEIRAEVTWEALGRAHKARLETLVPVVDHEEPRQ